MSRSLVEDLKKELRKKPRLVATGMDLTGIDLSQRAIIGIEFRNCQLSFSNFEGADLSLTRFIDCDLYCAKFDESVLYTTWLYECNLTKASFQKAFLLGFRLRNADITKAAFDGFPLVGLERKSQDGIAAGALEIPFLGALPAAAQSLEETASGIYMAGTRQTVTFLSDNNLAAAGYRTRLRVAETAKYLNAAHADNGYEALAAEYYVVERRQRRRELHGSFLAYTRRVRDFLFGEVAWRYGTSIVRPIIGFGLIAVLAAAITFFAPGLDTSAGLFPDKSSTAYSYEGWTTQSATSYLSVLYFFLTAPAGGSQDVPGGWVRIVFVLYLLTALWLIALVFEASTKRLGRST